MQQALRALTGVWLAAFCALALAQVREKVSGTVYDMKIRKDREACAADAYKVTRTKTAVEKMGAALSAKYKEVPKQIDAQRRDWNAKMDSLRDEVRKPLTEWEEAEDRRVGQHRANLANIADRAIDPDPARPSEDDEDLVLGLVHMSRRAAARRPVPARRRTA